MDEFAENKLLEQKKSVMTFHECVRWFNIVSDVVCVALTVFGVVLAVKSKEPRRIKHCVMWLIILLLAITGGWWYRYYHGIL